MNNLVRYKRSLLTCILILVFAASLFSIRWSEDLIHSGGGIMILQILKGLLQPSLELNLLKLAFESSWITLAYAGAGMTLAIVYAFIAGVLGSGILFSGRYSRIFSRIFFRGILGFTRSIHELVWAWLFVSAVGLSPFAAIFALAIPYGGILGRIFADMLDDVDEAPILALKATGASPLQCLFYGYLPIVRADMVSYTMYRFECAIRSSAIMSFVGLGGLGYQIQLSLADLKYNEVWTFVFFLIGLVILVDLWSYFIRKGLTEQKLSVGSGKLSSWMAVIIIFFSWAYIYIVENARLMTLLSHQNLLFSVKFLSGLLGLEEDKPAFLDGESWSLALTLTFQTFLMSILAIGIAVIFSLLTVLPAARNIASGSLTGERKWYNWPLFGVTRLLYIFSRAVPELIWAMMIIFVLKPGILPGALALALHNIGILGKLWAEVIEDLDERPIRNLASAGASKTQLLLYGVFPMVLPKFLTYTLYRWEVIMRTTIVVGLIGAGGLGLQFKLSMSYFHYSHVTLLLFCYMILVFFADFISEASRRFVR